MKQTHKTPAELKAEKKMQSELSEKMKKLEVEFDALNSSLADKKYDLMLNDKHMHYLNTILDSVQWGGAEAFALTLGWENLQSEWYTKITKDSDLLERKATEMSPVMMTNDLLETLWTFIIRYQSKGIEAAKQYVELANIFAPKAKELNDDRQKLRDLATEINAIDSQLNSNVSDKK